MILIYDLMGFANRKKAFIVLLLLAGFLFTLRAEAVPAWSRLYADKDTDCQGCHTQGGWQLNKMGMTFLRYGHRLEEDGDKVADSLADYTSFSFKVRALGGEEKLETFEQHSFAIYTGGNLGKGFSFFAELYFHENSGKITGSSDFGDYGRSKLAEAFIQYTDGSEAEYFATRFGQIQPQILHVNNMGARMSQGRPRLWTHATINNNNPYQAFSRQYGIDAYYHINGLTTTLGLVNGTGTQFNVVDNNQAKDIYSSVDYTWGRHGSNVGLLYYQGHYPITDTSNSLLYTDDYNRIMALGRLAFGYYDIMAAYLTGEDEVSAAGNTEGGQGYYVQPNIHLHKDLGFYARYERWEPDNANDSDGYTLGLSWLASEYGRFVFDISNYGIEGSTDVVFTLEANFIW